MENSKGVSNCPVELKNLLQSLNQLPKDLDGLIKLESNLSFLNNQSDPVEITNGYWNVKEVLEAHGLINKKMQLQRLIREKQTLIDILFAYRMWAIDFNKQANQTFTVKFADAAITERFGKKEFHAAISFNGDTTLNMPGFRILYLLIKYPVERVRTCPICQDIFWARRIESPACSEKHVAAFNSAKTRIKETEQLLKSEIQTYKEMQLANSDNLKNQERKIIKLREKIEGRKRKYGII